MDLLISSEKSKVYQKVIPIFELRLRQFLADIQLFPPAMYARVTGLLAKGAIDFLKTVHETVDLTRFQPIKTTTCLNSTFPYRIVTARALKKEDLEIIDFIDKNRELVERLRDIKSLSEGSDFDLEDLYWEEKREQVQQVIEELKKRNFFLKGKIDQLVPDFYKAVDVLFYKNLDPDFALALQKSLFSDSDSDQVKELKLKYKAICKRIRELNDLEDKIDEEEISFYGDEKEIREMLFHQATQLVEKAFQHAEVMKSMYDSRKVQCRYISLDWIVKAANKAKASAQEVISQASSLSVEEQQLLQESLQQMQRPLDQFFRMEHEHQYLEKLLQAKQQLEERPGRFSDIEKTEEELQQDLSVIEEELTWLKEFLRRNKNSCLEKMSSLPEAEKLQEEFSKKYAEQMLEMRNKIVGELYYFSGIHERTIALPE